MRTQGAVFYVCTTGNDQNQGTPEAPWKSIQASADRLQAGDTLIVKAGLYDERITTTRGGASHDRRIQFLADGKVSTRGWVINHPFVSVTGFEITGHTSSINSDGYIRINAGGDFAIIQRCYIRDGVAANVTSLQFAPPNQLIATDTDFLKDGFRAGDTISINRSTNITLLNTGTFLVTNVSATTLLLATNTIVADGPKPAYLSGANVYGLFLSTGTEGVDIISNRFSNLSYRYCFVQGTDHRFEGNILEQNNGWDLIFFSGTNHIFRGNWFRNNGWGVYQPSADVFDNWNVRYSNIYFINNCVDKLIGVINAQKRNNTESGPLCIFGNIFIDTGWFSGRFPNTTFLNNTFLRVADRSNVAVQRESHPLNFNTADYATNVIVLNNAFISCGEASITMPSSRAGWYHFSPSNFTCTTDGNFVTGSKPSFESKVGWEESPLLNGGDPELSDYDNPLGADGKPFTHDDGLRPRDNSRLLGSGVGGSNIGAYHLENRPPPHLDLKVSDLGQLELSWPLLDGPAWEVVATRDLGENWSSLRMVPTARQAYYFIAIPHSNTATYYGLRQR